MAVAISYDELEKTIEEKLFYRILFEEYLKNDHLIAHGFRITKKNFVINMVFVKELTVAACQNLARRIGEKYNVFVAKNKREEKPRWALEYPTPYSFSYQFFIESEHDETNLANHNYKKMILGH